MKVYEVIVCILIAVVIGLTLRPEKEEVIPEPTTEISFEEHPLKAWRDGNFVKIKYSREWFRSTDLRLRQTTF